MLQGYSIRLWRGVSSCLRRRETADRDGREAWQPELLLSHGSTEIYLLERGTTRPNLWPCRWRQLIRSRARRFFSGDWLLPVEQARSILSTPVRKAIYPKHR